MEPVAEKSRLMVVNNLQCAICMNLFDKPSVLNCGHSFCTKCIVSWLNDHSNCPICRSSGYTTVLNITLQQVVDEHRRKLEREAHEETDDSDEYSKEAASISRENRRCRFSDQNEVVYLNNLSNTLKQPPPASALPTRSALAQPTGSLGRANGLLSLDIEAMESDPEEPTPFKRNRAGRKSAYFAREEDHRPIERSNLMRRSIGVIRRKTKRKSDLEDNPVLPTTSEEVSINKKDKKKEPLWRRVLSFRRKSVVADVKDETNNKNETNPEVIIMPSPPPQPELKLPKTPVNICAYSGVGDHFKKIRRGDEITIVIFGKNGVGKTTFLDTAAISIDSKCGKTARMLGYSERMSWCGVKNCTRILAHMMSIAIETEDKTYVVDIIDADASNDAVMCNAYLDVADAAVLLYSSKDVPSFLTVITAHRQLSRDNIPCVLVGNIFMDEARCVEESMGPRFARTMEVKHYETDLTEPGNHVKDVLWTLIESVLGKREEDTRFLVDV